MFEATMPNFTSPVTPFWQLPEGMYLVKKRSTCPLIEHYGVLVTGNLVRRLGISSREPIVIHQTYPQAKVEWAAATGIWNIVGDPVPPQTVALAIERVTVALNDPNYNLFANNCEQFARFISEGQKSSTQLWWFALGGTLVAMWWFGRNDN